MLPKSQRRTYVGYNEGSRAIRYYNAATKNILTSRNFRFLVPSTSSPPEELAIDPGENAPPSEGELQRDKRNVDPVIPQKRAADTINDPVAPRKTRGIRIDYRYLNDPFPDEEEAGIADVRPQAFAAVLDNSDECHSLREAKQSSEWPEWEQAIDTELNQLKCMGTWKLVEKPADVVPIGNKFVFAKKRDKRGRIIKYKA